ncbi:sensor histidine kinase [Lachnospiraceae bacterium KM106-2]|nr:sensor histidine kinase [Lachnospiraceae bacterium KM106-2]
MKIINEILWLMLYLYYCYQLGSIEKGKLKGFIVFMTCLVLIVAGRLFSLSWISWLMVGGILLLFDLFYDEISVRYQWYSIVTYSILVSIFSLFPGYFGWGIILLYVLLSLAKKRGYLTLFNGTVVSICYAFLLVIQFEKLIDINSYEIVHIIATIFALLLFLLLEGTLLSYQKGFEVSSKKFQDDVLGHQYEEIKNIYLNMRGWRHDYHNHIQVMKAQVSFGEWEKLLAYLDELEQDLDQVDTYVKSGNLMIDAILNSKLSIAEQREIKVNCKANLPEELPITDIDLCVILGNLLDNAIEACEQIDPNMRFLRIYTVVNKKQFYLSIQNSAKEQLNFNERNYITTKRGNHGLGMKRVQVLVDKYEGYLNLANEPGIFAAEVTLPLKAFRESN